MCNVKTDEAESRAPATVVLRGTIETPVTRSVDLGACQAVIDTMGDVCVDSGGREMDVTVTAYVFYNLFIKMKSTLY